MGNFDSKTIIVFGTGSASNKINHLQKYISYYVDNNSKKWGEYLNGLLICNPEEILKEDKNQLLIIVASSFYNEISEQLKEMDLIEGIHFINGANINHFSLMDEKSDIEQLVKQQWESNKESEFSFWENEIENIKQRFDKNRPLQQFIIENLTVTSEKVIRIIDVGSGPATYLGNVWGDKVVEITPIDPLADDYNKLLDQKGLAPLYRTIKGEGEKLNEIYPDNYFDLVYSANALDHSYNPVLVIKNMIQIVKKGSPILLYHFIDEAEHAHYDGLHQWNFREENGEFIIWNPQQKFSVNKEISDIATINIDKINFFTREKDERNTLFIKITKF